MRTEFLPVTLDGRLWRLAEECSEVIKELAKAGRFGMDTTSFGSWSGESPRIRILRELDDLEHAIDAVRIDLAEGRE